MRRLAPLLVAAALAAAGCGGGGSADTAPVPAPATAGGAGGSGSGSGGTGPGAGAVGTQTSDVSPSRSVTPGDAAGALAQPRIQRVEVGSGPRGATIFRPQGRRGPLPGVIFIHGWMAIDPANFAPWIRHLVRRGNVVIYPAYQTPVTGTRRFLANALAGIRAALRRVKIRPGTLVVTGHSAGGALAADYAAVAAANGLPRPVGVYAVYAGRRVRGVPFFSIPAADGSRIAPDTEIESLGGADDRTVGTEAARAIVRDADRVAPARRRYVLIRDPAVAGHAAPLDSSPVARRTFWAGLDALIARARAR